MKSIQIELPDKLVETLDTMVQQGWFRSEAEVLRFALFEFLLRKMLGLAASSGTASSR
jgi:Arc/MetJ-type ribon-helix-helix transcriptional regulator